LFWLGVRKAGRSRRRLLRTPGSWRRRLAWLAPVPLVLCLAAEGFRLTEHYLSHLERLGLLGGCLVTTVTLGLLLGRSRVKKLNHKLLIAIQSGDYPKALALCEGSPAVVAGSTVLRYNHALIRAVLGRREEALGDLERLRVDDPGFKMTWLLLASLYADEGNHARALEIATQLSHDLPDEPPGLNAESWLLRKVGRLEEAEARARKVLELDPKYGHAHLTLAAVAFDRGDCAGARRELTQAERLVPGSVGVAMLAAEIALASEGAGAEAAVRQAVQAAKTNPLSFADKEAAALVRRLEALQQPPPG
jgi:tetratricopeptide (TPR) repeat protein